MKELGIPTFLDASLYSEFPELLSLQYSGFLTLSGRSSFLFAKSVRVNGEEYNFFDSKIFLGDSIVAIIGEKVDVGDLYIHADLFLISRNVWNIIRQYVVPADLIISPAEIHGKRGQIADEVDFVAIWQSDVSICPSRHGFRASSYSSRKPLSPKLDFCIQFVASTTAFPVPLDFFGFGIEFAFSERLVMGLINLFPDLYFDPIMVADRPSQAGNIDPPWLDTR